MSARLTEADLDACINWQPGPAELPEPTAPIKPLEEFPPFNAKWTLIAIAVVLISLVAWMAYPMGVAS